MKNNAEFIRWGDSCNVHFASAKTPNSQTFKPPQLIQVESNVPRTWSIIATAACMNIQQLQPTDVIIPRINVVIGVGSAVQFFTLTTDQWNPVGGSPEELAMLYISQFPYVPPFQFPAQTIVCTPNIEIELSPNGDLNPRRTANVHLSVQVAPVTAPWSDE